MASKQYTNSAITVHWDATRCIHTGICTRGLPQVFDVTRRPWISVDLAGAAAIAEVVDRCPTGALRYERHDGVEAPPAPATTTITPVPDGPLYVRGPVRVSRPDGTVVAEESRVALCRCGATANPPFCDSSHRAVGYRSHDPVEDPPAAGAASPEEICAPQDF